MIEVATSKEITMQKGEVATYHLAVTTSKQLISRTVKSRREREVAPSSQGHDAEMESRHEQTNGPVILKPTRKCIEVRAQLRTL